MALIASMTTRDKKGDFVVVRTELTGSDTLEYNPNVVQTLFIRNGSNAPAPIVIDGSLVTTVELPGQGRPVDNSAGFPMSIEPDVTRGVTLSSIRNFLAGTISVTGGGPDVYAWIVEG
jgi:hypothetical protein